MPDHVRYPERIPRENSKTRECFIAVGIVFYYRKYFTKEQSQIQREFTGIHAGEPERKFRELKACTISNLNLFFSWAKHVMQQMEGRIAVQYEDLYICKNAET